MYENVLDGVANPLILALSKGCLVVGKLENDFQNQAGGRTVK